MIKAISQIYNVINKDDQIFITISINVITDNINRNTLYKVLKINT